MDPTPAAAAAHPDRAIAHRHCNIGGYNLSSYGISRYNFSRSTLAARPREPIVS
jgi:hypothetical protein